MRIFECWASVGAAVGLLAFFLVLIPRVAHAQQRVRQIFQTDSVGSVKYHAPSWVVQPYGRVI